jgi:hypothetical protein
MSDWPIGALPPLVTIHPWSIECVGIGLLLTDDDLDGSVSAGWDANVAVFYPFRLAVPSRFVKAFVANGASVAGNWDIGIYDHTGVRLGSTGSIAQSGINALQVADIDVSCGPGLFYLAFATDSSSTTAFARAFTFQEGQRLGILQQTSGAFPLPATAAFEAIASNRNFALVGVSTRSAI